MQCQFCHARSLNGHNSRHHGARMRARAKTADATCPVCLRRFGGRAACLYHASKDTMCRLNLLLFYRDLDPVVREEADLLQAAEEAAARSRREDARYTGILAGQKYGPLRKLLAPLDSKRKNRFTLFEMYSEDGYAARGVDFEHIESLCADSLTDAIDEVPLGFCPRHPYKCYRRDYGCIGPDPGGYTSRLLPPRPACTVRMN